MENPGGGSGVRRIRTNPSLHYPLSLKIINTSQHYERWVSWKKLYFIVDLVKDGRIETGAQWRRIRSICAVVITRKKIFMYRELFGHLSTASLDFLFDNWRPPAYELREVPFDTPD